MSTRSRRTPTALAFGRVATAGALLLVTACGSTVQLTSTGTAQGADEGLGGTSAAAGVDGSGVSGSAAGGSGAGSTGGAIGQSGATAGSGGSSAGGGQSAVAGSGGIAGTGRGAGRGPAAIPTKGFGWDAKNIYIGYTNSRDNASSSPLGYDPGNLVADMQALATYVNDNGGLFGRKLVPLEFDQSFATISSNPASAAQAACSNFTIDHPVIGVLNILPALDNAENFHTCLAKSKVAEFSGSVYQWDGRQLPDAMRRTSTRSLPRPGIGSGPPMMRSLKKAGYFTGWDTDNGTASASTPVKTGIIYLDTPVGRADPRRAGQGHGCCGVRAHRDVRRNGLHHCSDRKLVHPRHAAEGASPTCCPTRSGVASQVAQSQQFFPRWGISTLNTPDSLPRTAGATQLKGSIGVGWAPSLDVKTAEAAKSPTPAAALCLEALRKGGQSFNDSSRFALAVGNTLCDAVRLLVEGTQSGGGLDSAALARGIASIGTSFKSAVAYSSVLAGNRQDMPGALRPLAYASDCNCYHYTGPLEKFTP